MGRKLLTLAYIRKGERVLLGMKRRGFGAGKWNGFGGKVHEGETFATAAAREIQEEAGVIPIGLIEVGQLDFEFEGDPLILETRVFVASEYEGEAQETEEMSPKWHRLDEIPYADMWDGDKYWLPLLLQGHKFKGHLLFDQSDKVLSHKIQPLADSKEANELLK